MSDTKEVCVRLIAYHPDPKKRRKFEKAPCFFPPRIGNNKKPVYGFDSKENMAKYQLSSSDVHEMIEALDWEDDSSEKIIHMMKLNISDNVRHKAIYHWILCEVPEIAKSKNSVDAKNRFYIENKEEEARVSTMMFTIKTKALLLAQEIVAAGSSSCRDNARLLGIPVKGVSDGQVASALLTSADTQPKAFLTIFDDKFKDHKIFISKLIDRGLIMKTRSGSYSHGDKNNIIAVSDNTMIAYLEDRANTSVVNMWAKEIGDIRLAKKDLKPKEDESDKNKEASITSTPKLAIGEINDMKSVEAIEKYILGEERTAVLKAAQERISVLSNNTD